MNFLLACNKIPEVTAAEKSAVELFFLTIKSFSSRPAHEMIKHNLQYFEIFQLFKYSMLKQNSKYSF